MLKQFVLGVPLLLLCALATCSVDEANSSEKRRPHDAAIAVTPDAPSTTGATVSCYTEGNPGQTCALPAHCCFSNYSSQHDGACSSSTCVYGTIACDGPEDCAAGERCCSAAVLDADGVTVGYTIACRANACGPAPLGYELCHLGGAGCANGGTCTGAFGVANDLPRALSVCR